MRRKTVFEILGTALALSLTLAALTAKTAAAQERRIRFDRTSLEAGLSQSSVNCILQDRTGFMWFGTQDGLNRFDGYRFSVFEHDPADPGSLSADWIWACLEDHQGMVWVGTDNGGLNRWEPRTQRFTRFRSDPSNPKSLADDSVRAIYEDSSQRLWIGTAGGLNLFDRDTGSFQRYNHDPSNGSSLSHNVVRSIIEGSDGALWIATYGGGLDRFDVDSGVFEHFSHRPDDPGSLSGNRLRTLFEDRTGGLWVGTYEAGLNRLDRETGRFERFLFDPADPTSLSDNRVRAIFEDQSGGLWIATDGGLNEWRGERRQFVRHLHQPADPASLSDDRVMSLFQDRGGVLWVGTQVGLNRWNPTTSAFVAYQHDPTAAETLTGNTITAFAESLAGDLWVGTYEGLNLIERSSGRIRNFRHNPRDASSIPDDRVMSLAVDSQGRLWLGTYEDGLALYDAATDRFERFQHDPLNPSSLSSDRVTAIHQDAEGVLWVATYGGGLNRLVPETETFIRYKRGGSHAADLSSDRVVAVTSDSLGILWIGTEGGGLNGFDRRSGSFFHFRSSDDEEGSLTSDGIFALHEDRRGTLWIGTYGGGLLRWDLENRREYRGAFTAYGEDDGLVNSTVYGIHEDDRGDLWISTNEGLSRLDPVSGQFRNYDTTHGLLSQEFNFGAHFRASTGEMLFGGNHGFNIFFPERIRDNPHRPPVALTGIYKFNEPIEADRPVHEIDHLTLGHRDSVISLEFTGLDFTAPERNRYAYMLEGFDDRWIEESSLRRATYTNLDPGDYVFRVRAANNDGVWNEEGTSLKIRVIPPPWRSWWAYCLYTLALGAVILGYTRAQRAKLEKEAEYSRKLEREVRTRTRELADRNRELEDLNDRLAQSSVTDSLTGLKNRRYLMGNIERDIALLNRFHSDLNNRGLVRSISRPDYLFLLFDLDGFKEVNDRYGHAAGDRVLVQVREILESACRESDTLIRWGGDEFLVVGRYADRTKAEALSDRLRERVSEHEFDLGGGQTAQLSCSIGFSFYPFMTSDPARINWEQVVAIADRALYVAKNNGRDAWAGIYQTEQTSELPVESLVGRVNEDLERLVAEGLVELRTSFDGDRELVWAWA